MCKEVKTFLKLWETGPKVYENLDARSGKGATTIAARTVKSKALAGIWRLKSTML